MAPKPQRPPDERDLLDALRARHVPPAWAFMEHVTDGTGANKLRTSDAMAMSLWPSRGLELHGFEIKSYRGDWLRELKDPGKADEIVGRCHRWWVVAAHDAVVNLEELPATWGLLVGSDLKVVREAPLLSPAPLDYPFLAAILRRAATAFANGRVVERMKDRLEREDEARRDPEKVRARLERLRTTASKISTEIGSALYQMDREAMAAKMGDQG